MANPWKDCNNSFGGIEELLQTAKAVAVFDKLVLDGKVMPVEPLRCKVVEMVNQMDEISQLEDKIQKVTFGIQSIEFEMEYKDLLNSAEVEKKADMLNEICETIGYIVKHKHLLTELLQQKGSSDALPIHRNFHGAFVEFFNTTASLLNNFQQNVAVLEQTSTMDPAGFRKYSRNLMEQASCLQKLFAELEEISFLN